MDIMSLFILAAGLAMDAFAVSICKGLAMKKATMGKAAVAGLWFGGFQALMPVLGFCWEHSFAGRSQQSITGSLSFYWRPLVQI